jgi:gluconokinase
MTMPQIIAEHVTTVGKSSSPLVLALDVGTSSARAIVYDAIGRRVEGAESHLPYRMLSTADGGVEIDADLLTEIVFSSIDQLLARFGEVIGSGHRPEIEAVALSTFWHNLLGVDAAGRAVTPIYSWNDTRSTEAARQLSTKVDERAVHERTGCMLHSSYWPAKLIWLSSTRPELFRTVDRWISFGDYLHLRLFGEIRMSISMASATGLFNQNQCAWDHQLLSELPVDAEHLPAIVHTDLGLTGFGAAYRSRWPHLTLARWFAALGDGACGNAGSGCVTRERAALMVGTSGALRTLWEARSVAIPPGLWCYRADRRRFVLGGALSNGGDLYAWINQTMRLPSQDEIETQLDAMEPDGHGLTLLPFLSGERSTGWAGDARAVISGIGIDTTPIEILRAGLEAVAFRFAAIYDLLVKEIGEPREIIASGGALLRSPAWTQIISDVLEKEIVTSAEGETSARGAALMALESMGALQSIEDVEAKKARVFSPDVERLTCYRRARERQEKLYRSVIA